LLPGLEGRIGVLRRDDDHVGRAVGEPRLRGRGIGHDRRDMEPTTGEVLVAGHIGRQAAGRRDDDDGLERAFHAVVAQAEDGHDQERTDDQADDRPRPANGLDELLADEGQRADDDGQQCAHQAA
jgi:hypothetical protein